MVKSFLFILIFSVGSCTWKQEKINPSIEDISESIYASGMLKSENQYQAFTPVSGIIQKIFVAEGDTVKKGAVILSISNETQQLNKENAALAAAFSDFEANKGKLEETKLAIGLSRDKMKNDSLLLSRQNTLWSQNIGTKVELEQRTLTYQNSKNAYYSALVKYNDLKRQLNFNSAQSKNNLQISSKLEKDYLLKSEINGIVYEIPLKVGEIVNAQLPLAVIGDAKSFILEMQVDEYDILKVKKGLSVLVTMDTYKGQVFEALVTKINPLMNEKSKTFLVEAQFTKAPKTIYPNTSFEANIVIQSKKKALLIPRNYLIKDNQVIKGNGDTVTVITGLKDYQKVEILSGLNATDQLIKPLK